MILELRSSLQNYLDELTSVSIDFEAQKKVFKKRIRTNYSCLSLDSFYMINKLITMNEKELKKEEEF